MINTPAYEEKIAAATQLALLHGHKVLQIFRFSESIEEHLRVLEALSAFPRKAMVLDMGCGVGEVARGFQDLRPDLSFVLLNNNGFQLSLCPPEFMQVYADMHRTHFADRSFGGVMLNYALGYADPKKLFDEIARILKSRGVFFIYDLMGDKDVAKELLDYNVYEPQEILNMCPLRFDRIHQPRECWADLGGLADDETIEAVLNNLSPVCYRFEKP